MFAIVTALCLTGLILILTVHGFRSTRPEGEGKSFAAYIGWVGAAGGSAFKSFPRLFPSTFLSLFRRLPCTSFEKVLTAGLILSFLYLVVSGFVFALIPGHSLFGIFLVLHVMLGGLFAICLTLIALLRARNFSIEIPESGSPLFQEKVAWKAMFWIFSSAGAVLIATALVPMLPLLTHTGQLLALSLHRYAALAAILSFSAFVYFGIKSQKK